MTRVGVAMAWCLWLSSYALAQTPAEYRVPRFDSTGYRMINRGLFLKASYLRRF